MSGIAVELAESIAHDIGLKLEWAQSVNFSTLTEDLAQGRYDAICASVFNLSRAGRIDYTLPYAYVPVYGHARVGDSRFDSGFASVDWSKVTVAGLDGEGATNAALQALPQAQFAILPQGSQIAEMLLSVADSKADIAFVLPTVFGSFNANNPGKLVRVQSDRPLYTFAVSFGIKPGEFAFKNMLDISLRQRIASGQLGALFAKYDPSGFFFQPKLY
jgi:ABC-type amino acid transport substrate-binding protein